LGASFDGIIQVLRGPTNELGFTWQALGQWRDAKEAIEVTNF